MGGCKRLIQVVCRGLTCDCCRGLGSVTPTGALLQQQRQMKKMAGISTARNRIHPPTTASNSGTLMSSAAVMQGRGQAYNTMSFLFRRFKNSFTILTRVMQIHIYIHTSTCIFIHVKRKYQLAFHVQVAFYYNEKEGLQIAQS